VRCSTRAARLCLGLPPASRGAGGGQGARLGGGRGTCLAALAAEPGRAAAAAGGWVAACSVLAVAALPAAGSVEAGGTAWDGELIGARAG